MKLSLAAMVSILVLFPSASTVTAQSKAYHCILYTTNAGKSVRYSSTPVLTDTGVTTLNAAWKQHVVAAYHVRDPKPYGGCQALAGTPAQQELVVTSAEANYKKLGATVVHDKWTNAPGQIVSAPASLPGPAPSTAAPATPAAPSPAVAAAPVPAPAASPTNYVWCHSTWVGTTGTRMPDGSVLYFTDVFAGAIPPPPAGATAGNGWAQQNASVTFQPAFFAFLQKKYGFKNGGNYPVSCSAADPLTPAGLQNAQKRRQEFEALTRQFNGQVVETGWSGPGSPQ
jgi:hypothetical protein